MNVLHTNHINRFFHPISMKIRKYQKSEQNDISLNQVQGKNKRVSKTYVTSCEIFPRVEWTHFGAMKSNIPRI